MKRFTLAVLLAGALAVPGLSQTQVALDTQDGAAPDVGVARISLISGDVTVRRGDTGEVIAAEANAPLVEKDHLLTAEGSRAEIQFDYANMIRVGPVSEVRIGELREGDYLVQVAEGTTTFRVLRDTSALVEISTPTVSVRPQQRGTYRVFVRPDGSTQVTVRSGQAEIFTPRGTETLRAGQTMEARGDTANPEYMISSAIPTDEWDRWNELRDSDLERSQSYQYVSNSVTGADDLDGYGRWVYDPPYGNVWVPNVATGWAPYRYGSWVNINYYGWTWLSADPWGWAPYHYGRWYYAPAYGWAWYPGVFGPRYYWRPALVSFFGWGNVGFGTGFGFGFGFGNIGWVPLAPYEVFRPWYGGFGGLGYGGNVVVNNINIINNYRNARFFNGRNGVTSVRTNNFGRGRVTNANFVRASANDLNRAGEVRGRMPFQATAESRRFSDRKVNANTVARASRSANTQFVDSGRRAGGSRGSPAGTAVAGSTNGGGRTDRARGAAPGAARTAPGRAASAAGTSAAPDAARTASRARIAGNETESQQAARQGAAPANSRAAAGSSAAANSGWRRFDQPSRSDTSGRSAQNTSPTAAAGGARADRGNRPNSAFTSPRSTATTPASGWRRFDSAAPPANTPAPSTRYRQAAPGASAVTRSPRSAADMPSRVPRSEPRSSPQSVAPQSSAPQRTAPQSSPGVTRSAPSRSPQTVSPSRSRSGGNQQPVRINPPIVQPRSQSRSPNGFVTAPRSASPSRPNGSFSVPRSAPRSVVPSGGGAVRSAPRSSFGGSVRSAPRSAPAVRSAPRSSFGGSASAPRSSFGGVSRSAPPASGGGAVRSAPRSSGGGGFRSSGGGAARAGGARGRR